MPAVWASSLHAELRRLEGSGQIDHCIRGKPGLRGFSACLPSNSIEIYSIEMCSAVSALENTRRWRMAASVVFVAVVVAEIAFASQRCPVAILSLP